MRLSFQIPSLLDSLGAWVATPDREMPEELKAHLFGATALLVAVNLAGYEIDVAIWRSATDLLTDEEHYYVVPDLARCAADIVYERFQPFPSGCVRMGGPDFVGAIPGDAESLLALHLRPRRPGTVPYAIALSEGLLEHFQDADIGRAEADGEGVWIAVYQPVSGPESAIQRRLGHIALAIRDGLLGVWGSLMKDGVGSEAYEAWRADKREPLGLLPMFDPNEWPTAAVGFVSDANDLFAACITDARLGPTKFLDGQVGLEITQGGERIDVMLGLAKHFELAMGWQPDLSGGAYDNLAAAGASVRRSEARAREFAGLGLDSGEQHRRRIDTIEANAPKWSYFWLLAALHTLGCVDVLPRPSLLSKPEFPAPEYDVTGFYVEVPTEEQAAYGFPSENPMKGDSMPERPGRKTLRRHTLQLNQAGRCISGFWQQHRDYVIDAGANQYGRSFDDYRVECMMPLSSEHGEMWGIEAKFVVEPTGAASDEKGDIFEPLFQRDQNGALSLFLDSTTDGDSFKFVRVSPVVHASDALLAGVVEPQRALLRALHRRPLDPIELLMLRRLLIAIQNRLTAYFTLGAAASGGASGEISWFVGEVLRRFEGHTTAHGLSSQMPVLQMAFRQLAQSTPLVIDQTTTGEARTVWGWLILMLQQVGHMYVADMIATLGIDKKELDQRHEYLWSIIELDPTAPHDIKSGSKSREYFLRNVFYDYIDGKVDKWADKWADDVVDSLQDSRAYLQRQLLAKVAGPRKFGERSVGVTVGGFNVRRKDGGWSEQYVIAMLGVGFGVTIGASFGGEDVDKDLQTLENWGPESFEGPIMFVSGQIGFAPFVALPFSPQLAKDVAECLQWVGGIGSVVFFGNGSVQPAIGFMMAKNTIYGAYLGADVGVKLGFLWKEDRVAPPTLVSDGSWLLPTLEAKAFTGVGLPGFAVDSAELTEDGWLALRRMCAEQRALLASSLSDVEIVGFCSPTGDPGHNLQLSEARAWATWQALQDIFGPAFFAETPIRVHGVGEAAAAAAGVPNGHEDIAWRRVEIRVDGRTIGRLGF
jgi:outer membrane protein OmpA-like peptidoglycan-associated protein